jgi:hypothetical protein
MTLRVGFHNPDFPDDIPFDIGGIIVPNGGEVELTEEQELGVIARHSMAVRDRFAGNKNVHISGNTEFTKNFIEANYGVGSDEEIALPPVGLLAPQDENGGDDE